MNCSSPKRTTMANAIASALRRDHFDEPALAIPDQIAPHAGRAAVLLDLRGSPLCDQFRDGHSVPVKRKLLLGCRPACFWQANDLDYPVIWEPRFCVMGRFPIGGPLAA